MTNTLHENGHWVQENKLDLVEHSSSDRNTMDRTTNQSTTQGTANQETANGTNHDDDRIQDDSADESVIDEHEANDNEVDNEDNDEVDNEEEDDESVEEDAHHSSVPYLYTGHLGTTSPSVLRHIETAIDQVVKHYQISKSDLNQSTASDSAPVAVAKPVNKTGKIKRRRKRAKSNHYHSFDTDQPFELNLPSLRKKKTDVKRKDQLGPFIRVEKKKSQTNYIVVNGSSKLEDKDNKLFNKPNYGLIAKSKSSNQILFKHNDNTWICVFCKRQPHYRQLGDLFGPHELINNEKNLDEKNSDSNGLNSSSNCSPSTSQHNNLNNSTAVKNEIWFHEDCIIWSNGIYLAGNRVRNIDEVVLECIDIVSVDFCVLYYRSYDLLIIYHSSSFSLLLFSRSVVDAN